MKNSEIIEENDTFLPSIILKKTLSTLFGSCFLLFFWMNKSSFWLQRNLIFLHVARWPLFQTLEDGNKYGIKGVKNFYLTTDNNVKIGVWQILPAALVKEEGNSDDCFEAALGDGKPIIIYVHGNSGTRASTHRLKLYKKFQSQDWHVVTFDYRSYGDSSAVIPNEIGVVEDTITVVRWVLERKKLSPVFVWGHSLGTGISSRSIVELEKLEEVVNGLILEAPFNCLKEAVLCHPIAKIFRHMIGFEYFVVQPLTDHGVTFNSEEYLSLSKIPLLILHAEDDWIIPVTLGRKLYKYLLQNRKDAVEQVKFVEFGTKNGGYGHKFICDCPSLVKIVSSFFNGELNEIPSNVN